MSVCAAAPPPCLPLEKSANFVLKFRLPAETSNSRNVHPVSVTFRLFVYSAAKRFGGKTFFGVSSARYDRIGEIIRCDARFGGSAATFFGVSSARYDRIGPIMRCDARFGGSAAYHNRRTAEKRENRRKSPKSCSTWNNFSTFHVERRKARKQAKIADKLFHVERR